VASPFFYPSIRQVALAPIGCFEEKKAAPSDIERTVDSVAQAPHELAFFARVSTWFS